MTSRIINYLSEPDLAHSLAPGMDVYCTYPSVSNLFAFGQQTTHYSHWHHTHSQATCQCPAHPVPASFHPHWSLLARSWHAQWPGPSQVVTRKLAFLRQCPHHTTGHTQLRSETRDQSMRGEKYWRPLRMVLAERCGAHSDDFDFMGRTGQLY